MVVACFATCLYACYWHIHDFNCDDLALRVGGAKQMQAGKNAYYYSASGKVDSVNAVVSTPLVIFFHRPLARLSSCGVKERAFWVAFILLGACVFFISTLYANPLNRYLVGASVVLFFIFSRYWFLHLRLGQMYILYTFFFFLLHFLVKKRSYFLFGLVLSVCIACRPLFIVPAAMLVLFYFNPGMLKGLLTGGGAIMVFTLATKTGMYWLQYGKAMAYYAKDIPRRYDLAGAAFTEHRAVPWTIYDGCQGNTKQDELFCIGVLNKNVNQRFNVQQYLSKYWGSGNFSPATYSLAALMLSLCIAFFAKRKLKPLPPDKYMLVFFLIYIGCEIFTPAPRGDYNYILWLFAASLVLAKGSNLSLVLMLIGLALSNDYPYIRQGYDYGEMLMLLACFCHLLPPKTNRGRWAAPKG